MTVMLAKISEANEGLKVLLDSFKRRKDLQDTFPEVNEGQYQALINWAAGVSEKHWIDKDSELLGKFKDWYKKNQAVVIRPKNEKIVKSILSKTVQPMDKTLSGVLEENDIGEHLTTLYFLTIEFNLKRTLELGVRDGISTVVLTEAASHLDGHVYSIDWDDCKTAQQKIQSLNLNKYWTFIQGDDIEISRTWNKEVDHIFIDTSHTFQHTLDEIYNYEKFLAPNGFITFHDTRSFPGVLKAISEFIKNTKNKFRFYNYFNNNGFAILRKME